MIELSIIIPAYNEEKRLPKTIKTINEHFGSLSDYVYEIIVIDDCSTDKTFSIAASFQNVSVYKNEKNMGKGYSVKKGILRAKYPLILFTDSDLATPIGEFHNMYYYIKNHSYDIVIASRNLKDSNRIVKQPFYRRLLGQSFPLIVRLLLLPGIMDTQCGFKLFTRECAKEIVQYQTINRFSFDVELLYIAKRLGFTVKECPVVWFDMSGSTVNPLKDGFRMLVDTIKIRVKNYKV